MDVLAWVLGGDSIRFLAVLVIATPCPLLLAIPIAIMGSISLCARRAIIVGFHPIGGFRHAVYIPVMTKTLFTAEALSEGGRSGKRLCVDGRGGFPWSYSCHLGRLIKAMCGYPSSAALLPSAIFNDRSHSKSNLT